MLYNFELVNQRVRLWQRVGESYEHVLMKALGYAMFVREFPQLEIETRVGLRYKPDLVARAADDGRFLFWGECGANSVGKTVWLVKHAGLERLVLFKIGQDIEQLADQLRDEIAPRYRPYNKVCLINFISDIVDLTATHKIEKVPAEWYNKINL